MKFSSTTVPVKQWMCKQRFVTVLLKKKKLKVSLMHKMLLVYKQNLGLLIIFSPLAKWEHWHRTLCGLLKPTWRCKNSPSLLKPRVEPSIF